MKTAIAQIELFSSEVLKPNPSKKVSPRLNKHAKDFHRNRFKSVGLEPGWIIVGWEANGDFKWVTRDIEDCQKDLKELADGIKRELQDRFKTGFLLQLVILYNFILMSLCFQQFISSNMN